MDSDSSLRCAATEAVETGAGLDMQVGMRLPVEPSGDGHSPQGGLSGQQLLLCSA